MYKRQGQIKNRADRILDGINENIWILSTVSMNSVIAEVDKIDPDIIIVDSIQTFASVSYTHLDVYKRQEPSI